MALDLDHPIHQAFLRLSQAMGRPWPPDPFLGSLARLRLLQAMMRAHLAILEAKLSILDRLFAQYDRTQAEAAELLRAIDDLAEAAEYIARDAAREKQHSPWAQ